MKIALAQINTTVGDFAGNVDRIVRFARCALEGRADLVIFPELALCGYPPRDLVEKPSFIARSEAELERLAQLLPDIPTLVGYVRRSHAEQGKAVSDAAALLHRGKHLLDYNKSLLAFYDVFDESRYFEPGSSPGLYTLAGWRLGVTICEDIWNDKRFWKKQLYARDPVEESVRSGANLLLNMASSPFATGKIQLRHDMLRAIAIERQLPVVYVNQVGGNDQLIFDGSSLAFNARGELCTRAKSFEEDLVIFDASDGLEEVHPGPASEIEAVYQALLLGTRDYVVKCGFKKVIIGLSGGIDSSLVATLAADALGPENVLGVSMPGPYSSPGSLRDAEALAGNLRIELRVIPIRSIFDHYLATLDPAFAGLRRDTTEENIQARIRGNILMALSNKFGSLVLSTGNKSELAVGYCTLYGDMAGGLAVIADLPKTMVYELARYLNRASERIPIACLEKAPSVELRADQIDQDTLPPYEVLDIILKAYIEENLCAQEIIETYQLDPDVVWQTVRRVNNAEYKRQQAAPTLKVTAKAFGMGRRYPIASKFSE
ncbi:MAG: NAD+ synthase [Acidobacteria bacterium]|nr:MAG: NAD+ synthase [Acidobacteriota bacterium]